MYCLFVNEVELKTVEPPLENLEINFYNNLSSIKNK